MNSQCSGVILSIFLTFIHYNPNPQGQLGELAETTPLLRVRILTGTESSNLSLSAIKPPKTRHLRVFIEYFTQCLHCANSSSLLLLFNNFPIPRLQTSNSLQFTLFLRLSDIKLDSLRAYIT